VRWSLIFTNFEDLDYCSFEHGSGLSDLRSLLELAKLVHGHDEAGTWRWLDIMSIDLNELLIEVASDTTSLLISVFTTDGCATLGVLQWPWWHLLHCDTERG
jgi:hypothetical protein